jgi:hypothetical protein
MHNEDTHAYRSRLYGTGNALYKETCLLGDFRNCGQPSTTGLSAYSYPLTQFLSNEKLQQVMVQIETTLMFWLPGRQPEAWRNIAARMATFVLKCTSKSQADTLKRTFHYYTTRTTRIPLLHNTYNAHSIITQHVQRTFHYYTTRTTRIPLLHNTYNTHSIITQHVQHAFHYYTTRTSVLLWRYCDGSH